MTNTSERATLHFRRQHAGLSSMAVEILTDLDPADCEPRASRLREQMALFGGKLKAHTIMEDQELYPRLRSHANPEARKVAHRLWSEFGSYYDDYFAYYESWSKVGAIENDPAGFVKTTRDIMLRLGVRMNQENDELYTMVDRLHEGVVIVPEEPSDS